MAYTGLSSRMSSIIATVMPKIAITVAERNSTDHPRIDLATVENWVVRDELVAIYKEAIARELSPEVNGFSSRFILRCTFLSITNSLFIPTLRLYSRL